MHVSTPEMETLAQAGGTVGGVQSRTPGQVRCPKLDGTAHLNKISDSYGS